MLPKLVIADLSCENPKDILIAERLQRSQRTRHIAILLITTKIPSSSGQNVITEMMDLVQMKGYGKITTMGYPFAFSIFWQIETLNFKK